MQEYPPMRPRRSWFDALLGIALLVVCVVALIVGAQTFLNNLFGGRVQLPSLPIPTAIVIRLPIQDQRREPAALPGIAQNEATATAQYNQAIKQQQNGAIVLPQNDPAPVLHIQEQTDRQPAGDNVPVAEPVQEGAPVINIQETHQCKHGQVWTDAGCKNPLSDKGSKRTP